uniref:C2H2-type domain-containing protein n=1 Tax=Neogobius melanostomus TaxID=47308 RepID=A0A8C6WZE4_9GOBI
MLFSISLLDVMPLSSLRLLVSPLQLMAAALWGIVQHRAVMHYGLLEDFITTVLDIIPELLTHSERVQLVLGLRAKVGFLSMHNRIFESSLLISSVANFINVVNILLEDPYERGMFYLETFPSVFGSNFDSALCALVRKFLMNLEKLLPVPNLDQVSNLPLSFEPVIIILEYYRVVLFLFLTIFSLFPVCGDDSIFSSFIQMSTDQKESKVSQKCKGFAPEDDMGEEHVGEVTEDVTLGCKISRENVMDIDYSQEMLDEQTDLNRSDSILIETCISLGGVPENNDTQSELHPNQSSKESEKTTTNQSTMKCTVCDKTFSNLIIMRRHYHYTHNMKHHFPCPTCKRTFVRLYDLVKHHENGLLFQCKTCKWCYTSESELSNHKKLFNDTCALFYNCEVCGKSFKEARNLQRHETVHLADEEKPVCSYCDKTFSSKMALEVHMNRHTGGFSCSICAKVFHQKIFLKRHMDRHNGQEPYLCEICGKGWPTEKYLQVHMIKHSDERPFTCDKCGMTFKSEATLKSHYRRKHTNVRPFKCSVCSKAFAFSRGLKLHMMKHTGIRPFVCSRCGKGFRRSDELKTHQIMKCF